MLDGLVTHFEQFFQQYGYTAMFVLLMLENAGLPVPGETALLYASFLAYRKQGLELPTVIFVGILAAILGDSTGFWVGRLGGPRVAKYLFLTPPRLAYFEKFFARYGAWTVFFARFIAGLRIIGGPAAGLCGMPWPKFLLFNSMGGVVWVTVISLAGYTLGQNWELLLSYIRRFNIAAAVLAVVVAYLLWRRQRRTP